MKIPCLKFFISASFIMFFATLAISGLVIFVITASFSLERYKRLFFLYYSFFIHSSLHNKTKILNERNFSGQDYLMLLDYFY